MMKSIKELRQELLEEIKSLPAGPAALAKISHLRQEFDSAIDDYQHSLSILSDTTYQDRKHFLLELIQNADDAIFGGKSPDLSFVLYEDRLELHYNEVGFQTADVVAITGTGSSTKSHKKGQEKSFIGEKGIGFKSVFALASEVEIESPPWHFKLMKENIIVPHVMNGGRLQSGEGTRLVVRFTDALIIDAVGRELQKYVSGQIESFLFLQKISNFRVENRRTGSVGSPSLLTIEPSSRTGDAITLHAEPSGYTRSYALYSEELEFAPHLVVQRWERMTGLSEPLQRNITVAALTNLDSTDTQGRLFCFLPTDVRLPVPLYLQVDGHLKADRERLHDPQNNEWNRYLLSQLPQFLVRALLHWRHSASVSAGLLNYVPIESGTDQLSPTFDTMISMLRAEAWVRTFEGCDECWVKPGLALVAPTFWLEWLSAYPEFRSEVETRLGKRFVNASWTRHPKWKTIAVKYGIRTMDPSQQLTALMSGCLPLELTKSDHNLIILYEHLVALSSTSEANRSPNFKRSILHLPIFPLDNGRMGTMLDASRTIKPYWVSSRSRRATGFETAADIRIVDSEYTYRPEISRDLLEDRAAELRIISERNEKVRDFLKFLGVSELNDDAVLSDLQIPYLLSPLKSEDCGERYKVLAQIVDSYLTRSSREGSYMDQISRLSNALLQSNTGVSEKLGSLLLPPELRIFPEDHLFDSLNVKHLFLPEELIAPPKSLQDFAGPEIESRDQTWREELRQFFIQCGICVAPRFTLQRVSYEAAGQFRTKDPARHKEWIMRVGGEYTPSNSVVVETVTLDSATKQMLDSPNLDGRAELAVAIYNGWRKYVGGHHVPDIKTLIYTYNPPVGYFKASYTRQSRRSILASDNFWGGVSKEQIPLRTVSGDVLKAHEVLRTPRLMSNANLRFATKYFPLVEVEGTSGITGSEYWETYLDSLKIGRIQATQINKMWETIDPAEGSQFLRAIIELINAGVASADLALYDKKTNQLRPVADFRLGMPLYDDIAYIEDQYGEDGKRLGELLGLRVESEATVFCERLGQYLQDVMENQDLEQEPQGFADLILSWNRMVSFERREAMAKLPMVFQQYINGPSLLVILNDRILASHFNGIGTPFVELTVADDQLAYFQDGAREMGFQTIRDLGTLEYEGKSALTADERVNLVQLLSGYMQLLEAEERSRFLRHPLGFGKGNMIGERVVRATRLSRQVGSEVCISIELPYYDDNGNILVSRECDSLEEIMARLVSASGLATYRSACRDIRDLPKPKKSAMKDDASNYAASEARTVLQSTTSLEYVRDRVQEGLVDKRSVTPENRLNEWNLGMDPSDEVVVRSVIHDGVEVSLRTGPTLMEKQRRELKSGRSDVLPEGMKLVDEGAGDPKEFLITQYDGRCQVCSTQLRLSNGGRWVDVFRITEGRGEEYWVDRPFNILGLCPNCHALAKHGGGLDLSSIQLLVREASDGKAFPIEIEEHNGDFYVTTIQLNGTERKLILSQLHLAHFMSLFGSHEVEQEAK